MRQRSVREQRRHGDTMTSMLTVMIAAMNKDTDNLMVPESVCESVGKQTLSLVYIVLHPCVMVDARMYGSRKLRRSTIRLSCEPPLKTDSLHLNS